MINNLSFEPVEKQVKGDIWNQVWFDCINQLNNQHWGQVASQLNERVMNQINSRLQNEIINKMKLLTKYYDY